MKYLQTRALVLRSRPFAETDRLLTLLTWDEGKISAKAPGARRVKSKLAAAVEVFTCGSFLLYRGRTIFTVSQAQVDVSFREQMVHVENYARGHYFAELTERLIPEGEPNPDIFEHLLAAWSSLQEWQGDRELLTRYFELRLLLLLGFQPHCENCLFCGDLQGPFYWNAAAGGLFCERCRPPRQPGVSLSRGSHALLRAMQRISLRELKNLRAPQGQQKELADFIRQFIQYWTETGTLKSLTFIRENGDP